MDRIFPGYEDALCLSLQRSDPTFSARIFFSESDDDAAEAIAVCYACPVRLACLEYAVSTEEYGVWGGTTEDDRWFIRLQRRQPVPGHFLHGTRAAQKIHAMNGEKDCRYCREAYLARESVRGQEGRKRRGKVPMPGLRGHTESAGHPSNAPLPGPPKPTSEPKGLPSAARERGVLEGARPNIGQLNAAKTHCNKGHAFDRKNTYFTPKGSRACRLCRRDASRNLRARVARASQARIEGDDFVYTDFTTQRGG